EVLEHVPDIDQSLKEIRRVLKPQGRVLITVPFVWTEHELPFDFRRFTQGGIEKIMSDHGFEVLQSQKVGSYVGVIFQMIMMYLHTLLYTSNKYLNLVINAFLIAPVAIVGLFFNLILPKRYNWYFNTIILASKK
ncbi:MAG: class I SAM-dependent methyltransferase, partial [Tannerellaceae bacterium]